MSPGSTVARLSRRDLAWAAWLLVAAVSALRTRGHYHFDEFGQITSFVALELGVLSEGDQFWEYGEKMRPWLQPGLLYVFAAPLAKVFGPGPLAIDRSAHLVQLGLLIPAVLALRSMIGGAGGLAFAAFGATWFLPGMLVRHSSEAFSTALLVLALFFAERGWSDPSGAGSSGGRGRPRLLALAGLFAGLAFYGRFQVGFIIAGAGVVLAIDGIQRRRGLGVFAAPMLGFVAASIAGVLVDRWGYGEWVLSPVRYFEANILRGKASEYGVQPPWYYLVEVTRETANPLIWVWLVLGVRWAFRLRPGRSDAAAPIDRAIAAGLVLFAGAHFAVSHKEARFLIPAAPLLALLIARAESSFPRWAVIHPRFMRGLIVVHVVVALFAASFGVYRERYRVADSIERLSPGSTVIVAANLFGERAVDELAPGFELPEGPAMPYYYRPRDKRLIGAPASSFEAMCRARPEAFVMLTPRDAIAGVTLVDLDLPAVGQFPPSFLKSDAPWYKRIWRHRLVSCTDLVPAIARIASGDQQL